MNTKEFLAGLNILLAHFKDPSGYHLGAEHDTVYVYATDLPVAEHNLKILHDLGWGQEDCVKDGEWLPEYYDPEASWRTRWLASIKHVKEGEHKSTGKMIRIGYFDTEIEAAEAYNAKARELRGEWAWLNPIPGEAA